MFGGIYDTSSGGVDQNIVLHKIHFNVFGVVSKEGQLFVMQESFALTKYGRQSIKIDLTVPAQKMVFSRTISCGPIWVDINHDIWLYRTKDDTTEKFAKRGKYPRHIQTSGPWIYCEDDSILGLNFRKVQSMILLLLWLSTV